MRRGRAPLMADAAERKMRGVAGLLQTLSDQQVAHLAAGLTAAAQGGAGELLPVLDLVIAEAAARRACALALAPLTPQFRPAGTALSSAGFPSNTPRLFWNDLCSATPDATQKACAEILRLRGDDPVPSLFDELCQCASDRLVQQQGLLADAAGELTLELARALRLTPMLRSALTQLQGWLTRPNPAQTAAARLAFADAAAAVDNGGPLFISLLAAHLDEPWQVLRLIAVMADRPSDKFLAVSELAPFGEALLTEIDQRVQVVHRFDADGGRDSGLSGGEQVTAAATIIAEFELQLQLHRDGPWGCRIGRSKRALASAVEARLRELGPAADMAFPLQPARIAKRLVKGVPRLTDDPNAGALVRVETLGAFLSATHVTAAVGGFGVVRAEVLEALEERMAHYVEDLLEIVHQEGEDAERARAYLDAAAGLVGLIEGERSAEVVRRRAAAA